MTGVSLGAEPAEAHVMAQPPRPPARSALGDSLWKRILRIAVLLARSAWRLGSGRSIAALSGRQ